MLTQLNVAIHFEEHRLQNEVLWNRRERYKASLKLPRTASRSDTIRLIPVFRYPREVQCELTHISADIHNCHCDWTAVYRTTSR